MAQSTQLLTTDAIEGYVTNYIMFLWQLIHNFALGLQGFLKRVVLCPLLVCFHFNLVV